MARLISGQTLRRGGSGEFIDLRGAQPQLPVTPTTGTGFTLITDSFLRTSYRSSLGFIEFNSGTMFSAMPDGSIRILSSGTSFSAVNTYTANLVVQGGIGVGANIITRDDITVNGLTIGQGYRNDEDGAVNNIVIRAVASTVTNDFSNGQNSVVIGYDALQNLNSAYKSIAIGRLALSSGTNIRNSIAIGDSALKENGVTYSNFIRAITSATVISNKPILGITNAKPAVVTVDYHNLSTGSRISIYNVNGVSTGSFSLVNEQSFFVETLSTNTFALYNSLPLTTSTALDTTLGIATAYVNSGTLVYPIEITVPNNDYTTSTGIILTNFTNGLEELEGMTFYVYPLGSDRFQLYDDPILSDGADGTIYTPYVSGGTSTRVLLSNNNIAIGTNAGKSLYDGERNFFLGDFIAQNLTTGSYNFFLGHEVGNNLKRGSGNVSIMGDNLVDGRDNQVNIGGIFYYNGAGYLQLNADTGIGLGTAATGTNTGALAVLGGISVSENIITYGPVQINDSTVTTSSSNGALTVIGGVGIGGDLRVGGIIYGTVSGAGSATNAVSLVGGNTGTVLYQSAPNVTAFLPIGNNGEVLTSDGTLPVWSSSVGIAAFATSAGNANEIFVDQADTTTQYYLVLTNTVSNYTTVTTQTLLIYDATDSSLSIPKVNITSNLASTSTNSNQALVVSGGIASQGSIRSPEGQVDENYLLYTPRVTISTSTPLNARIGDFWIDPNYGIELQFIKDGTSTIWIQFTGI